MPKFKEVNFWFIYLLISAVIILISSLTFYSEWRSIKNKYIEQISNINQITHNNTLASFRHQESVLKILGNTLLQEDVYNYPEFSRKTLEEVVEINQGMVAFGVIRYDGQLLLVSNIPFGKKLPNLMKLEKTKASFKQARNSKKMQLGRTYLLKASNSWGMPIRLAIWNRHGEVPFVIAAGVRLEGGDTALHIKELPKDILIQLVRSDGYVQFQNPIKNNDYSGVYDKPFDESVFKEIGQYKNLEQPFLLDTELKNEKTLSTVMYMKEYDLYTIVSTPYRKITEEFSNKLIIWVLLLIAVLFVLFWIFRYSINLQQIAAMRLRYMAEHDSLTNLPNRLALQEEIDLRMENRESFYVLFLDLDNFKHINDTYGHNIGDELLRKISYKLRELILDDDYLARQGGDEFIILVKEKQHEPIRNLASSILEIFNEPIEVKNNPLYTGTSIGISKTIEGQEENASQILNQADIALYKAKETKNAYVFFTDELYEDSKQYIQIESALRQAIKKNELYLTYQPKVDAKTLKITGVEALLRWENDYLGFVPPDVFIPVAEKSGMITKIGEYVLKKACEEVISVWEQSGQKFNLSINVSPRQLVTTKERVHLKRLLLTTQLPKEHLIIEVTENVFISDTKDTVNFLESIRKENIGVSLDDFGTGFSSLSILSKLPLTELKIDKSFVQNMLLNHENMMLVKSIVNIGKDMHLNVVAEGVETKEELALLQEMGCEKYQGYYFSKPLKKDDLLHYLKN